MSDNGQGHPPAIASLSAGRAAVYQVLAVLYLEPPSPHLVSGLLSLSGDVAELFDGEGAACLRRYASAYAGDIDALWQEFHDLFTVPLGRYVTPYEAVYRDERVVGDQRVGGLLMGPSTLAVMAAYREGGTRVPPECAELPDHVGIELNFMAFLCGREHEAWRVGEKDGAQLFLEHERRFLKAHLLQWVPALSRRIAKNATSDFYRGVGLLTEEFIQADAATLVRMCGDRGCFTSAA